MTLPRVKTLAAVGLGVLVLAGCGSARPGVALEVEGQRVSLDRVESMAAGLCGGLGPLNEQSGSTLPRSSAQTEAAAMYLNDLLAQQFADEFDLSPTPAYAQQVSALEQEVVAQGVAAEHVDPVVEFLSTHALVSDLQAQAGRAAMAEQGTAEAPAEQAQQAGAAVFAAWSAERDVEIDPRFGLGLEEGNLVIADNDLSVAVSEVASIAQDPQRLGELPASLRCS